MASENFDWLGIVVVPVLMTIFVGGFVGVEASRWLLFEQTLGSATATLLELSVISDVGEYREAVITVRTVHARLLGYSLSLLPQGHPEAADELNNIVDAMHDQVGEVFGKYRSHFRGEESDNAVFEELNNELRALCQRFAAHLGNVQTPFYRYLRLRRWKPPIG